MKKEITFEEIQKIKEQAEDLIAKIIIKVEKDTNCYCEDIKMFINELEEDEEKQKNSLEIDLGLRIPFRIFKNK